MIGCKKIIHVSTVIKCFSFFQKASRDEPFYFLTGERVVTVCLYVCVLGVGEGRYMIFPTINIVFLVNHRIPRAAIKLVVHDLFF